MAADRPAQCAVLRRKANSEVLLQVPAPLRTESHLGHGEEKTCAQRADEDNTLNSK